MTPAVYPCICRSTAREGDVNSFMSAVPSLLSTADKAGAFRTILLMRCSISTALVYFILCLLDTRKDYLSLGFRSAQSSAVSLVEQDPTALAAGQPPRPRELLPAHKPAASSRKMEGNGDTKSARSEEEGAQRRKGEGADAIPAHLPAPLRRAVTSSHGTCCTPSAHRGA